MTPREQFEKDISLLIYLYKHYIHAKIDFVDIDDYYDKYKKQKYEIIQTKNKVYWERNQLVAALSKVYKSWIEFHPKDDLDWENDWRTIIHIELPTGQARWHIHDSEFKYFSHLEVHDEINSYDGHSVEQKYERLRNIDL